MGTNLGSGRSGGPAAAGARVPRLELRLLGPIAAARDGVELRLPASRKTRALLAYLALTPGPIPRSRLCDLLWDGPRDPRAELRWSLSRLRPVLDAPGGPVRLRANRENVALDATDVLVDVREVASAVAAGLQAASAARQRALLALFRGELLEGLEVDGCPEFDVWLTAQRRRFRGCRLALLERLAGGEHDDDAGGYLEQWLALAPFDMKAHEAALARFARLEQFREGDDHLRATVRMLAAEGLDAGPLCAQWTKALPAARRAREAPAEQSALERAARPSSQGADAAADGTARRASIAVLPFVGRSRRGARQLIGDAFARDVIGRLAKLRSLFVIAPGTMLALRQRNLGPEEAGRVLNVDYVAAGSLHRFERRVRIAVDLVETRSARVIWSETFERRLDDTFRVLDETCNRIVAEIAGHIELVERNRALLKPPSSLNAWGLHHRGLWHAYRFNRRDNDYARRFFAAAIRLDPAFSRAYAGLSFTHFQAAFQAWGERGGETERALETSRQALLADDRDPAAHWAMGRALWLQGRQQSSLEALDQAVELSPNFAAGHYMRAFVHAQNGDPHVAIEASDLSRNLSPFDPLLFGMLGARALALLRLERYDEAADYAVKAAARPNAHAHIAAIAAVSLALAGAVDEGVRYAGAVRRKIPSYGLADLLSAFRFERGAERQFRAGARLLGMT